jgi:hypothetical protein
MTEPPRLHTEPESELERSLLDAGRTYTASSSSRAKALTALGVVGVTASSSVAASAITKASVAKWIAATALLAGVAVPAMRYLQQHSAEAPPAAKAVSSGASSTSATSSAADVTHAPAPNGKLEPNSPLNAAADRASAPAGLPNAAHSDAKPVAPTALADELSALDAARSALAAGNATAALGDLDAYARNFPHGRLNLEAEVLRIDALAKNGQSAAAQKRAQAFMKRHPDSVLASRVRAYAGQ